MLDTVKDQAPPPDGDRRNAPPLLTVRNVDFWYGQKQALFDVSLDVYPGEIVCLMGPSGCGKTTLLKLLNRMQDEVVGARMTGQIVFDGQDIDDPDLDVVLLRRRFGWVAQKPNPFPKSVRENIAFGPRIHSIVDEGPDMDNHVEDCLRRAQAWDELKDRLEHNAIDLSGGQQQRLCIARALSIRPDMLLMDEPCASIDPIATAAIEELILELKEDVPVVMITHSMAQARRLADRVAFFHLGRLIESGPADRFFDHPQTLQTRRYLMGAFG